MPKERVSSGYGNHNWYVHHSVGAHEGKERDSLAFQNDQVVMNCDMTVAFVFQMVIHAGKSCHFQGLAKEAFLGTESVGNDSLSLRPSTMPVSDYNGTFVYYDQNGGPLRRVPVTKMHFA